MFANTRGSLRSFKQHVRAELQLLLSFFKFMVASFLYDVMVFARDPFGVRQRLSWLQLFASPQTQAAPTIALDAPPIPPRRHHVTRQLPVFEAVLLPDEEGQLVNVLFNKKDNRWELNPSMGDIYLPQLEKHDDKEKVLLLCSKKLVRMLGLGKYGESMLTVDDADNGRVDTYQTAVTQLPHGHDYLGKRGELLTELSVTSHDIFHIENLKHYLLHAYNDLPAAVQANAGAFMGSWLVTVPQLLSIIDDPATHLACKTAFWDLHRLGFASTVFLRPGDRLSGAIEYARASGDISYASIDVTTWLCTPASSILGPELAAAVTFLTTPPPGDAGALCTPCPRVLLVSGTKKPEVYQRSVTPSSVAASIGSPVNLDEGDLPTQSPWVWARKAYERDAAAPKTRVVSPSTASESSFGETLPLNLTSGIKNSSSAGFLAATPPKAEFSGLGDWIDDDKTPTRHVPEASRNTSTETVASSDLSDDSGDETPISTVAHQGSTPGGPEADVFMGRDGHLTVPSSFQGNRISSASCRSTKSYNSDTGTDDAVSSVTSVSPVLSAANCGPVFLDIPGSSLVVRQGRVKDGGHTKQEDVAVGASQDKQGDTAPVDSHGNIYHVGGFIDGRYQAGEDTEFRSLSDSERSRSNTVTALGEIEIPNTVVLTGDKTPKKGKGKAGGGGGGGGDDLEGACRSPNYSGMYSGRRASGRKSKFKPSRGGSRV